MALLFVLLFSDKQTYCSSDHSPIILVHLTQLLPYEPRTETTGSAGKRRATVSEAEKVASSTCSFSYTGQEVVAILHFSNYASLSGIISAPEEYKCLHELSDFTTLLSCF